MAMDKLDIRLGYCQKCGTPIVYDGPGNKIVWCPGCSPFKSVSSPRS
jgi:hypothetical protein